MSSIKLLAVSKRYGAAAAVDEVTLDVAQGEFVTILGPSGSGKTTTLLMIAGFVLPDSGDIRINDASVVRQPPHRRNVGMVFQNYALFPHMTVAENIAYPLSVRGWDRRRIAERVAWALGLVASPLALLVVPLVFLTGFAFAGLGLIMTSLSPSYGFFMYYFTLFITPMMLVCGVFFPVEQLPGWLQSVSQILPLTHAVSVARPLMNDAMPPNVALHLSVLAFYAVVGFYIALVLTRRRLLK